MVVGGKVGWRSVGDTWRIGHWVGSPQPSLPGLGRGEGGEWRLGRDEERSGETPGETDSVTVTGQRWALNTGDHLPTLHITR